MNEEIPVTEARARLSELVNRAGFGKERIVLTRHGRPLVALVPAEVLDGLDDGGATPSTVLDLSSRPSGYGPGDLATAARTPAAPRAR